MSAVTLGQGLSSNGKGPTVMRYERVQTILEAEPALRDKLGPKDQEVLKKNGEIKRYSSGTIAVTSRLHAKGLDAHTADKALILSVAVDVLRVLKSGTAKKPDVVKPEPVPKKPEEPPQSTKPEPVKRRRKRKVNVTEQAPVEPPACAPVASASPAPEAVAAATPSNGSDTIKVIPALYPFVSVLSLLHSIYNLLKLFDREPGAEKRQEKIAEQIDEMYRLKDVSVPVPLDTLPQSLQHGTSESTPS